MDPINKETLTLRARRVVLVASQRHRTLSFAESCTGGLLSAILTDIPGVSSVFNGSIVSYSNQVKRSLLNVPEDILINQGAVSRECSLQMALGARSALKSDYAWSITGIAGPSGGSEDKPVGTVWIGVSSINGALDSYSFFFPQRSRTEIRFRTVLAACTILESILVSNR